MHDVTRAGARGKIAVLIHARDTFEPSNYLLPLLAGVWKSSGIEIAVLRGPDRFEAADALILHIDLTVIPRAYRLLSRRYPLVINGRVRDISKRRVSANLVGMRDPYDGPVIVKTNRNFGGIEEIGKLPRGLWGRFLSGPGKRLHWSLTGRLSPNDYSIYRSRRDVPRAAWLNPALVIERFIPEREGNQYAIRQWIFMGDRGITQRLISPEPIIKSTNVARREYGASVPEGLRALRVKLGFDYGKFDFVLCNGKPMLLDANWTPTFDRRNPSPRLGDIVDELSQGLHALLAAPRRDRGVTGTA